MTTSQFYLTAWHWNPWLVAIAVLMLVTYSMLYRSQVGRGIGWLLAGMTVWFLALASPIDVLADGYLFSAHMLQHLLLLLIVPPLILLSLPTDPVPAPFKTSGWAWANWILSHPLITWILGIGGMWIWHEPRLCNAAVTNVWIHRFQYLSLLLMGLMFWWPIIGPVSNQRLSPPLGIVYLFSACLGCTILGIILTFAPVEVCSVYLHPQDRLAILPLIQDQWGLTPARDQQLGGLLMWVPACLVYFCGIFVLMARWYGDVGNQAIPSELHSSNTRMEKTHGQ